MSARQYRKKPIVVEAMHWDGSHQRAVEIGRWSTGNPEFSWDDDIPVVWDGDDGLCIVTLEGEMWARPGWWVIKGVKGEFYPCKPDIFDASYEVVEMPSEYPLTRH